MIQFKEKSASQVSIPHRVLADNPCLAEVLAAHLTTPPHWSRALKDKSMAVHALFLSSTHFLGQCPVAVHACMVYARCWVAARCVFLTLAMHVGREQKRVARVS